VPALYQKFPRVAARMAAEPRFDPVTVAGGSRDVCFVGINMFVVVTGQVFMKTRNSAGECPRIAELSGRNRCKSIVLL
jgi:hypothetical protein